MKPVYQNQKVNYVDAERKIRLVSIVDILSPTSLHLELGENHIALADYNEDKTTPNTWHFPPDDDTAASAVAAPALVPFKPGPKAAPPA